MYSILIETLMSKQPLDMNKMHEISKELFKICEEGTKNFNLKL